ncbi:hypothetical protein SKAU_G00051970 [Synaphobranchus kaupii]|uniref:Uncharacterized protein n=1 Tax=Synaphobranchus kaupii TaxID=118154 RepID=A0A9Q1G378_SYNKA|nr:hypothetical protein SKAU_G00051970 [Synaphobranchus kaupii]
MRRRLHLLKQAQRPGNFVQDDCSTPSHPTPPHVRPHVELRLIKGGFWLHSRSHAARLLADCSGAAGLSVSPGNNGGSSSSSNNSNNNNNNNHHHPTDKQELLPKPGTKQKMPKLENLEGERPRVRKVRACHGLILHGQLRKAATIKLHKTCADVRTQTRSEEHAYASPVAHFGPRISTRPPFNDRTAPTLSSTRPGERTAIIKDGGK